MRLCCLLVWMGLVSSLGAQQSGFQLNLLGQRQLAMGNAATALTLDASSGFFNPGGLVFTPHRFNLLFGATAIRPLTQFLGERPSTYQASTDTLLLTPIHFYTAWRGQGGTPLGRIALGLSVNNPFSTAIRWPDDWRGRFISQEFSINTLFIQPTLSVKVSDRVGVGAGVAYAWGNLLIRRAIQIDGPNGTEGSAQFAGTGQGLGFNLGLHVDLSDKVHLALSYRSSIRIEIDSGMASFKVPESVISQFPDQAIGTTLPLPPVVSLGLSYQPQQRLLLSFEINWVGWQVFDSLNLNLAQPVPFLRQFPERSFRSSLNFRTGGEYRLDEHWRLRAGVMYDSSPVPQGHVSPDLPDANRIGLSIGVGTKVWRGLSIDLSYAYAYTGERTSTLQAAAFSGIYQSTSSTLGLGLGYGF